MTAIVTALAMHTVCVAPKESGEAEATGRCTRKASAETANGISILFFYVLPFEAPTL